MSKLPLLAALALISLTLTACGDHYDKDGHYVSYDTNGRTVVDTEGNRTYFPDTPPNGDVQPTQTYQR